MKKLILVFALTLLLSACGEVSDPVIEASECIQGGGDFCLINTVCEPGTEKKIKGGYQCGCMKCAADFCEPQWSCRKVN